VNRYAAAMSDPWWAHAWDRADRQASHSDTLFPFPIVGPPPGADGATPARGGDEAHGPCDGPYSSSAAAGPCAPPSTDRTAQR
jgi:hypothetical protein